jgi:hypothetical protein
MAFGLTPTLFIAHSAGVSMGRATLALDTSAVAITAAATMAVTIDGEDTPDGVALALAGMATAAERPPR